MRRRSALLLMAFAPFVTGFTNNTFPLIVPPPDSNGKAPTVRCVFMNAASRSSKNRTDKPLVRSAVVDLLDDTGLPNLCGTDLHCVVTSGAPQALAPGQAMEPPSFPLVQASGAVAAGLAGHPVHCRLTYVGRLGHARASLVILDPIGAVRVSADMRLEK